MYNDNKIYGRLKKKIADRCLSAEIDWNESVMFGLSQNAEVRVLSTKIVKSELEEFKKSATFKFFYFICDSDLLSIIPEIDKGQFKYDNELWRKLADAFIEGLHRYVKNGYRQVQITDIEDITYYDELKREEINELINNYWKDNHDI